MEEGRPEGPAPALPPTQEVPNKVIAWLTTVQGAVVALTSLVVAAGALVVAITHFGGHGDGPANTSGASAVAAPVTVIVTVTKGSALQTPVAASSATPDQATTSAALVPLYTLPANAAGQMGAQQGPIAVTLGGRKSPNSTAVTCGGSVTFQLDGKYRHLVGWAGVADFAPSAIDNLIYIKGDGKELQTFAVTPDKVLPVDLEVTGVKTLELDGSDRGISKCTDGSKTYDYLGNAFVS